jgi:hypothetical protein
MVVSVPAREGSTTKAAVYDSVFYDTQSSGSYRSAKIIVPLVRELLPVQSVCDVGCGVGTWLSVFRDCGIMRIQGIDGDYVDRSQLLIPSENFHPQDLTQRVSLDSKFDLAMSLEVAEHLPRERAPTFVEDLTRLAPVVLFSAAIPRQGGTGHVNEQWPAYWAELFDRYRYTPIDAIRPLVWNDVRVERWYCQNVIIYCCKDAFRNYPRLRQLPSGPPLPIVHPRQYLEKLDELSIREASACFNSAIRTVLRDKFSRLRRRLTK